MSADDRVRNAFDDLAARAAVTPATTNHARPDDDPSGSDPSRGRTPLLLAALAVAAVVVVGAVAWIGRADDGGVDAAGETEDGRLPLTDPDLIAAIEGDGVGGFDARSTDDVFLVSRAGEGLVAGFASSPSAARSLPSGAVDAAPDGAGGIVYVTEDEVWHLPAGTDEPSLLERPGTAVDLIGPRTFGGTPVVLVRIGAKIIAYTGTEAFLAGGFPGPDGAIVDLDVARSQMVAVVEHDDGARSVEVADLDGDETRTLLGPIPADHSDWPVAVALVGDHTVVVGNPVTLVLGPDGGARGEIDLPARPDEVPVFTVDGAGTEVVVAFGEAALRIDIESGQRTTVDPAVRPDGEAWSARFATGPAGDEAAPPELGEAGTRYRVDTEAVAADTADPFLNVRAGAGVGEALVAKLPPTYRGLRATGAVSPADDGGTWIEVELLDPVAVDPVAPLDGANPTGWVNSAFVLPLVDGIAFGTDVEPACGPGEANNNISTASFPAHVYALESAMLSERCLRVVVTFGEGRAPVDWIDVGGGAGPTDRLPDALVESMVRSSGSQGTSIDLGDVSSAWPRATDTDDDVYIVRHADGSLDLEIPVATDRVEVTGEPAFGVVVIDIVLADDASPPLADDLVVVTPDPLVGAGSIEVSGLARPFEATLGVSIVDGDGEPVEAVYSGSSFLGTSRRTEYGVMTTDWIDAWGRFAVRAEDLAPGDYVMVLDDGAGEPAMALEIPFTITAAGPTPTLADDAGAAAAQALSDFARGGPFESMPLAAEVDLGLGLVELRTITDTDLADRSAWVTETDEFDGLVGPFSALDLVAQGPSRITAGPIDNCAGPPLEWPAELDGLRQVNIEPIGVDSCLQWYGVHLFLDDEDRIAAVLVSVWGP